MVEHWRGFIEAAGTYEGEADKRETPSRRRRRRRRRRLMIPIDADIVRERVPR